MSERIRVAIVGGGPAGCTLAGLLALRGVRSVVFDDDKRPELLVGESLLPTVVLVMRRLGIEERAAGFSTYKPGVSFLHRRGIQLDFTFPKRMSGRLPNYAYNVPRPQFDDLLRDRAGELGAVFVRKRAKLVMAQGDPARELWLDDESLAAAEDLHGRQPDLLIDTSGRSRLAAKVLGLGARRGGREDVAYFAHFEDFASGVEQAGRVVISVLDCGWSWRIPLNGRMSVGIVIDREEAKRHGGTAEERMDSVIRSEPLLAAAGHGARRLTPVMSYSNYQLISDRGHGPGWVSVGDAYGFVDPMLSPGLFMAMESASLVDRHVFAAGARALDDPGKMARGFDRYVAEVEDWHKCWRELIEYFYDGRMFSLYEGGENIARRYGKFALPRLLGWHLTRQIAGMASGLKTRSGYSRRLLRFATERLMWNVAEPEEYAISR